MKIVEKLEVFIAFLVVLVVAIMGGKVYWRQYKEQQNKQQSNVPLIQW